MHFVTGGAFNGKSKWVKAYYRINEENGCWLSFYHDASLSLSSELTKEIIVFEGVEQWVKGQLADCPAEEVRRIWQDMLKEWQQWEKSQQGRTVIIIGSDITKGIVPLEAEDRDWRDVTGRVFQDTALASERVDQIWYGIDRRLK